MKLGILFLDESQPPEDDKHKITNEPSLDIFGQPRAGNSKKTVSVIFFNLKMIFEYIFCKITFKKFYW